MHTHNSPPSEAQWRARIRYTLRALTRDAQRYQELTMAAAPTDLNTPHIDYLLRPGYVAQLRDSLTSLAQGVSHVEVHARYRRYRPEDGADLTIARQHLTAAAAALYSITQRAQKGPRS